jgi:HAAS
VSTIDDYLAELSDALHVRGAVRRRFLRECRDHLADAAAARGEHEAVRAFGPASEIAAGFDAEVAARRGVRSTFATAIAVLATAGSTLALIHAASTGATAPAWWATAFFVAAQVSAVAAGLALVQALVLRRSTMAPAEIVLLARRNGCALVAAGATMFSAGAAVPGRASAVVLLAGPVLACAALVAVLRARSLARRLDGQGALAVRPPLEDLGRLVRVPIPALDARRLLLVTTAVAAAGAFARDRMEHGSVGEGLGFAGLEGVAVVVCFFVLGPALGLWRR